MPQSPRHQRRQISTGNPGYLVVVTDDGSRTLRSTQTGVTWHSESGALAESQLVFLENSGVDGKIRAGQPVRILETGFGTGLNFWLTASLAIREGTPVCYTAFETDLIDRSLVEILEHARIDACQPAVEQFADLIFPGGDQAPEVQAPEDTAPEDTAPESQRRLEIQSDNVSLVIHPAPIEQALAAESDGDAARQNPLSQPDSPTGFDAIYHDPFGPEDAPHLWTEDLFRRLYGRLNRGGSLVTYCVKSEIQRRLVACGFSIRRTRGPVGGKREVLIATRTANSN